MVSRKGQPLPELVVTTNSTSRICYGMIQLFGLSYDEFGSCNKLYKLERAGYTPGAVDPSSQPACIFVSRNKKMLAMMIWEEIVSELHLQEDWIRSPALSSCV